MITIDESTTDIPFEKSGNGYLVSIGDQEFKLIWQENCWVLETSQGVTITSGGPEEGGISYVHGTRIVLDSTVILPVVSSDIALPYSGSGQIGESHQVKSVDEPTHSFMIDGAFEGLSSGKVAYVNYAGHLVSIYNVSSSYQDYDQYKYWVSSNTTYLTNTPSAGINDPRFFLDYIILKYPRFDELT